MNIVETIRRIVMPMIKPSNFIGEVVSFDSSNWTCEIKLNNGAKVENVSIKSVVNDKTEGIFVEPIVGSKVLCGSADGKIENLTILAFSEVKRIKFIALEEIFLMGDEFGGIPKVKEIEDNLKTLKNAIELLKTQIPIAMTTIGVGTAANGPGGASSFQSATASMNLALKDMENKKVKHG